MVDSNSRPIRLFCDNVVVVRFVENQNVTSNNRHIKIKYYYVLNKKKEGCIEVLYVSAHDMIVDPLTKELLPNIFKGHVVTVPVFMTFLHIHFYLQGFFHSL